MPIAAASPVSSKIVRHATLKVYERAPHSLAATYEDQLDAGFLAFIRS